MHISNKLITKHILSSFLISEQSSVKDNENYT
jgi:hypothetical protein